MSELGGVPQIRDRDFAADVSIADSMSLVLRGSAEASVAAALTSLIEKLHQLAVEQRARVVHVDMTQLEFMNASSFNVLVDWLSLLREAPADERYVLRFRSSSTLPWQRRSLHTLACFASHLVELEG